MDKKEKYSDMLTKGRRTYFFDIRESEQGALYLQVSESKKTENGFERHHLIVFEEDIKDFSEVLNKAFTKFKELKEPNHSKGKTYSVEKIRETHQQAYLPWTKEDDHKLEMLFCEGKKAKELAELFGRNIGAINSRIKKLELQEKYGK